MSQLGAPLDSEIVSWGTQLGISLLKTSERGPSKGKGASTSLLAAFWRLGPKNTFLSTFLMVLSGSIPLLLMDLPASPPTCRLALFLSLSVFSFSLPSQMNQAPVSWGLICASLGGFRTEAWIHPGSQVHIHLGWRMAPWTEQVLRDGSGDGGGVNNGVSPAPSQLAPALGPLIRTQLSDWEVRWGTRPGSCQPCLETLQNYVPQRITSPSPLCPCYAWLSCLPFLSHSLSSLWGWNHSALKRRKGWKQTPVLMGMKMTNDTKASSAPASI